MLRASSTTPLPGRVLVFGSLPGAGSDLDLLVRDEDLSALRTGARRRGLPLPGRRVGSLRGRHGRGRRPRPGRPSGGSLRPSWTSCSAPRCRSTASRGSSVRRPVHALLDPRAAHRTRRPAGEAPASARRRGGRGSAGLGGRPRACFGVEPDRRARESGTGRHRAERASPAEETADRRALRHRRVGQELAGPAPARRARTPRLRRGRRMVAVRAERRGSTGWPCP